MDDSSSKSLVMNKGVVSIASSSEGVKPVTHNVQLAKEADLGISEFVSPNISGFSGILKKRYTDFLVNEILPSGKVAHLDDLEVPSHLKLAKQEQHDRSSIVKKRYTDVLQHEILPSGQIVYAKAPEPEQQAQQNARIESTPAADLDKPNPVVNMLYEHAPNQGELTETNLIPENVSSEESIATVTPVVDSVISLGINPSNSTDTIVEPAGAKIESDNNKIDIPVERQDVKPTNEISSVSVLNNEDKKPESAPEELQEKADGGQHKTIAANALAGWQSFAREAAGSKLSPKDSATLSSFFDVKTVELINDLFNRVINSPHRKIKDYGNVNVGKIVNRELRTKIHQEIRRIFSSRLDSSTDGDGNIVISAANQNSGWGSQGGYRGGRGNRGRGAGRGDGRGDRRGGVRSGHSNNHGNTRNPQLDIENGRRPNSETASRQSQNVPNNLPSHQKSNIPPPHLAGKPQWKELGGEYLHFSLYKENKDTMEIISYLAKQLQVKPKAFAFAGTKDRRAVTVQRISGHRLAVGQLAWVGSKVKHAKLGNYEYSPQGLELGELAGNEFVITLRDCHFPDIIAEGTEARVQAALKVVETAAKHMNEKGFINYFGLQRFGTFATRTDTVGMKLLQEDFKGAVDAILHFHPDSLAAAQGEELNGGLVSSDDKDRALAIHTFKSEGEGKANIRKAIDDMPHKFSAEWNIMRYLGVYRKAEDYLGALKSIPRNLRLMYVHAYQSFVWNVLASQRWKTCGSRVVEGDLVLVDEHKEKVDEPIPVEEVDADGEIIVQPGVDDSAADPEDQFMRARALTNEEAESGEYTIFDVVLPTPGYDILYPAHLENFYESFMSSEEGGKLDPHNMRRSWNDISLSGSYRKLIVKPYNAITASVHAYSDENKAFVETDYERWIKKEQGVKLGDVAGPKDTVAKDTKEAIVKTQNHGEGSKNNAAGSVEDTKMADVDTASAEQKLAVVLTMQLGSSQYATMALRELMKLGVESYKPEYGGGR